MLAPARQNLRILHVLRSPVGGLFRHVVDLASGQAERGHDVGIIADSETGGTHAARTFEALGQKLRLGLLRIPMNRHLGIHDLHAVRSVAQRLAETQAEIIHGHGAKGGAYARLQHAAALRVYTPHGGTLHYSRMDPVGFFYLGLERLLSRRTDLLLFESAYANDTFTVKVGKPTGLVRVVHNGVAPEEFEPIVPEAGATDLVFVGELRWLKGVDVLIDALAELASERRIVSATIVGDGPERDHFHRRAAALGLSHSVRFTGPLPPRDAFAKGKILVLPSRAESLPYVVLEAAAAGVPIIATRVGGVPEIFGAEASALVAPNNVSALAHMITECLHNPLRMHASAALLRERIRTHFAAGPMIAEVLDAYGEGLSGRKVLGAPALNVS